MFPTWKSSPRLLGALPLTAILLCSLPACSDSTVYNPGDPASEEYTLTQILRCLAGARGSGCTATGAGGTGDTTPISIPGTGTPRFVDVSAGAGANSGQEPSAVFDYGSSNLLIAAKDGTNGDRLALFRCEIDGANCTYHDISAGQAADTARIPVALFDGANNKLLVVTRNFNSTFRPSLFRCEPDGTGCTHHDISAGAGPNSGNSPAAIIDETNSKLLVATDDDSNGGRPGLFRCNLDGSGCTHTDISAGQGASSCNTPSINIDTINNKLLVACANAGAANIPVLFRCNLDGSACTYTDMSIALPPMTGHNPSVLIDLTNGKLLTTVRNITDSAKPYLVRCDLDGTNCSLTDIAAGEGSGSGSNINGLLDTVNGKLLVSTRHSGNGNRPALFRCDLDGSNCTYTDMSAGRGDNSGMQPTGFIDTVNGRFIIIARDDTAGGVPAMFWN